MRRRRGSWARPRACSCMPTHPRLWPSLLSLSFLSSPLLRHVPAFLLLARSLAPSRRLCNSLGTPFIIRLGSARSHLEVGRRRGVGCVGTARRTACGPILEENRCLLFVSSISAPILSPIIVLYFLIFTHEIEKFTFPHVVYG